ncbi:MAG: hypothetical protein ACNA7X_04315 [Dehalococcoidia bacterium]
MIPKTQEEMMREMHLVIMGVPGTENRGLIGDVKDIKKDVRRINGDVQTNTAWRKAFCFIIPFMAAALGLVVGKIFM